MALLSVTEEWTRACLAQEPLEAGMLSNCSCPGTPFLPRAESHSSVLVSSLMLTMSGLQEERIHLAYTSREVKAGT